MPTATLENWSVDFIGISSLSLRDKNFRIVGMCFGDTRKRFRDGEVIYTSLVCGYDHDAGVISTLNSNYKLGTPLNAEQVTRLQEIAA